MGETIDPTEAWGYVGQMLGKQPESSSTQALEGSVGQMLPHLDTASLRAAPAQERVAEMQKLVRQMNSEAGADKMSITPGDATIRYGGHFDLGFCGLGEDLAATSGESATRSPGATQRYTTGGTQSR